jgi:3-oxoacyl-[acyl-carrier-protein] synthase II
MALEESQLEARDLGENFAVAFGTSMNGLVDIALAGYEKFLRRERIPPWTAREFPAQAATTHVAADVGARGPMAALASGCAAGVDAISWAAERIRFGEAVAAIAGGSETPLEPATLESFREFGMLASWHGDPANACRPFERHRTGVVVAEGAAAVALEREPDARARRAKIYARVLSVGRSMEPSPNRVEISGESAARSIVLALEAAGLSARDVDYVCAHGNAIPEHDVAETAALKLALGAHAYSVPVSSIRSMCGQAMSASSAIQVAVACLAIRDQRVPPTINYEDPDPRCDLDYVPNKSRLARLRHVLVHVRSIGGAHVSMLLGAPE